MTIRGFTDDKREIKLVGHLGDAVAILTDHRLDDQRELEWRPAISLLSPSVR